MRPELEQDFRDFVESRWSDLVRTAVLLTGDHSSAEDLVQQALVIAHRKWGQLERRHEQSSYAYVRAVMVNLQNSWWRRRRVAESSYAVLPERPGDDETTTVEHRDELCRALLGLPAQMRACVVLRYFEDLSEAETAAALGISLGSVKSQTSRGLSRLRERIHPATNLVH